MFRVLFLIFQTRKKSHSTTTIWRVSSLSHPDNAKASACRRLNSVRAARSSINVTDHSQVTNYSVVDTPDYLATFMETHARSRYNSFASIADET